MIVLRGVSTWRVEDYFRPKRRARSWKLKIRNRTEGDRTHFGYKIGPFAKPESEIVCVEFSFVMTEMDCIIRGKGETV